MNMDYPIPFLNAVLARTTRESAIVSLSVIPRESGNFGQAFIDPMACLPCMSSNSNLMQIYVRWAIDTGDQQYSIHSPGRAATFYPFTWESSNILSTHLGEQQYFIHTSRRAAIFYPYI
jgi:hypothetical protein